MAAVSLRDTSAVKKKGKREGREKKKAKRK